MMLSFCSLEFATYTFKNHFPGDVPHLLISAVSMETHKNATIRHVITYLLHMGGTRNSKRIPKTPPKISNSICLDKKRIHGRMGRDPFCSVIGLEDSIVRVFASYKGYSPQHAETPQKCQEKMGHNGLRSADEKLILL